MTHDFKKALLNRCHVGGSRGRGSGVLVAHPRSARAHIRCVEPETSVSLEFRESAQAEPGNWPSSSPSASKYHQAPVRCPHCARGLGHRGDRAASRGKHRLAGFGGAVWEHRGTMRKSARAKTSAWLRSSETRAVELSRGRDRRAGCVTKRAVGARFRSRAAGGGQCPPRARDALCRPQAAPGLASSSSALPASSPGYIFPPANPTLECQPLTSVRSLYFPARCVRVFSGILTIKFFLFSLPGAPPPL